MKRILVIGITSILLCSGMLVGAGGIQSSEKHTIATQTNSIDNYNSPEYGSLEAGCLVNLPEYLVTMIAEERPSGWPAFFRNTLSGITGDYDVSDGTYEGWCVEYGKPIPNNTPLSVSLFSSYCPPPHLDYPDAWHNINYILNHKQGDRWDIQYAIWEFLNLGPWQSGVYYNPTQTALDIVADANANSESWIPVPGDVIAVICDPPRPGGINAFQYTFIEIPVPDQWCYEGETAWAQGTRYVPRGNWAMYVTYDLNKGGEQNYPLKAGQIWNAGTVAISPDGNGNAIIKITLYDHWYFTYNDIIYEENVKIQDYASKPPKKNPAPGLFTYKFTATGQEFTSGPIPLKSYYGIHADIWHQVPCEPPLWYSLAIRICQLSQYFPNALLLLRHILNNYNY